MEKLINKKEIIAVTYPYAIKRQHDFGYSMEEKDSKYLILVEEFLKEGLDYKYFDKYGNIWTIEEIEV